MLTFIGLGGQELILLLFVLIPWNLVFIIPLWQIFKKSGQNPLLSLLALIPVVGLVVALFVAAYSRWKVEG